MNIDKDHEKIFGTLEHNIKLLKIGKKGTKAEHELILLTVIHVLKKLIDDIIKNWQIAES